MALAPGADENGDGFTDLLVGAPGGYYGRAYVLRGGPTVDAVLDRNFTSNSYLGRFGSSVAALVDYGAGADDLVVGAPGEGRVYLSFQPEIGLECPPYRLLTPDPFSLQYGLTNKDGATRSFDYTLSDDSGWFPPVSATRVIAPGDSTVLEFVCTPPRDPACPYTTWFHFTVRETGCSEVLATCSTRIDVVFPSVELQCPAPLTIDSTDPFALQFSLTNRGVTTRTFAYSIISDPLWCLPVAGTRILAYGDTAYIDVLCTPPTDPPCPFTTKFRFEVREAGCSELVGKLLDRRCLAARGPGDPLPIRYTRHTRRAPPLWLLDPQSGPRPPDFQGSNRRRSGLVSGGRHDADPRLRGLDAHRSAVHGSLDCELHSQLRIDLGVGRLRSVCRNDPIVLSRREGAAYRRFSEARTRLRR